MTDDTELPENMSQVAEYALGLLSAEEARACEALMSRDPELRAEYAFWADHFASLTDDIAEVNPPAAVWTRIEAVAFPPEQAPSQVSEPKSWFARFGLPSALGGGLLAALAVLWIVGTSGWMNPPAFTAELLSEDTDLLVQASFDDRSDTLTLTRNLGPAEAGRAYELWLIPGGGTPVSLGVMPDGQTAEITLDSASVAALADGVLAISDEPEGGSPTGAPTGAILAIGPLIAS